MNKERILLWIFVLVLAGGLFLVWFRQKEEMHKDLSVRKSANMSSEVEPSKSTQGDVSNALTAPQVQKEKFSASYIGYVKPIHAVAVLPYLSGFIDEVMVLGGEEVHKNQPIAKLKQEQYMADVERAKAGVISAEADLKNAKAYYERIKKAGDKAVSKAQMDQAQANFLSAEASLESAKAALTVAGVNYDYTFINAGIDGVIGDVMISRGDYVSPAGQAIVQIIQLSPIRVQFSIPAKDYLNLKEQLNTGVITLTLSNGQVYSEKGAIKFMDNSISTSTDSLTLYADFENKDKVLLPNAYVEVSITDD